MDGFGENIKKVLLAGIGAVAITTEKSKDLLNEMVKKGELTVEQGKVLNEELKHNIKKTVRENVNVSVKASSPEELADRLMTLLWDFPLKICGGCCGTNQQHMHRFAEMLAYRRDNKAW